MIFPTDLTLYTKRHVLDAIGSALAGAQTKVGQEIIKEAKARKDNKEATIIGNGAQISATGAFKVNSALGRLRDSSSGCLTLPDHPGQQVIFAGLSAGELLNADIEDIIKAITIAYELVLRMGHGVLQIAWPPDEPYPNPTLGGCFTLPGIATIVEGPLVEKLGKEKGNIFAQLLLKIFTFLKAQTVPSNNDLLDNDELKKWSNELISQVRLPKSAWHQCLIRKVGLKSTLFDQFIDAPTRALIKVIRGGYYRPEEIEQILLKGVIWLEFINIDETEDIKLRTACTTYLYLSGIYPNHSWYINGPIDNPPILDLARKILLVEDFEDLWEMVNSESYQYTAQVNTRDSKPRLGKIKYGIAEIEPVQTTEQFKKQFEYNTSDIIGTKQAENLWGKILNQENIKVPELMKLTYPKLWPAYLLRKLGVLVDTD